MKYIFTFVLFTISFYGFSQRNYQTDTIYYSDDTRYEYLEPHLKVGQVTTYRVLKIDIDIENGDTTKHEKSENVFSYSVIEQNDTSYFVELTLDDESWENILFERKQPDKIWQPKEVPPLIFQLNKRGDVFQIYNCREIYDYLLPFIHKQVDYNREIGETGSWMRFIEGLAERLKDCDALTLNFSANLNFLHQLYGTPVPIDSILKYELKTVGNENHEVMSIYMKINKEKLPDGQTKYLISEDKERGPTAMDQFYQSILEFAMEIDSTVAQEKVEYGHSDFSYIIFDEYNFPIKMSTERSSFMNRNKKNEQDYYLFIIEKVD